MAAPKDLSAEGRRMWAQAERELRARKVWRPATCAPLLRRLVENRIAAANALEVAEREPVVEGSTGQPSAHPLYAVAARCDQVALSLARQLTLTTATAGPLEKEVPDAGTEDDGGDPFARLDELAPRREARAQG